jgi:hypothetical protein
VKSGATPLKEAGGTRTTTWKKRLPLWNQPDFDFNLLIPALRLRGRFGVLSAR